MNTYSHVMPEMGGATARAMDAALEAETALGELPHLVPLEPETTSGRVPAADGGLLEKEAAEN